MNAFIVADKILYHPILQWMERSSGVTTRARLGVTVFTGEAGWTLIAVNPWEFSLGQLSGELRRTVDEIDTLNVIAPSFIQYFASKMLDTHPIYRAINTLSRFPVVVDDAPVFRMQDAAEDDTALRGYKHAISYASFPTNMDDVHTRYLVDGAIADESALGLEPEVSSVAVPLLFHHSGLARQEFKKDHLIAAQRISNFERLAFDELMLRFPSRVIDKTELGALANQFKAQGLTVDDIETIWDHNRQQWMLVVEKLAMIGVTMPLPVEDKAPRNPAFDQFTHLIVSNFFQLAARIDADIPGFRHVGISIAARNGVSIPLDAKGLIGKKKDAHDDMVQQRVDTLLPKILLADYSGNVKTSPIPVVMAL